MIVICRPNHEAVTVRIIGFSPNYLRTFLSVMCSYWPVIRMFKFLPLLFYLTFFKLLFFLSVGPLSQRPRFDPRPVCVGLMADEVHWASLSVAVSVHQRLTLFHLFIADAVYNRNNRQCRYIKHNFRPSLPLSVGKLKLSSVRRLILTCWFTSFFSYGPN